MPVRALKVSARSRLSCFAVMDSLARVRWSLRPLVLRPFVVLRIIRLRTSYQQQATTGPSRFYLA